MNESSKSLTTRISAANVSSQQADLNDVDAWANNLRTNWTKYRTRRSYLLTYDQGSASAANSLLLDIAQPSFMSHSPITERHYQ